MNVEDILEKARRPKGTGKVERWSAANPKDAKLFWGAVAESERTGSPGIRSIIEVCQKELSGPPGSYATILRAVRERTENT